MFAMAASRCRACALNMLVLVQNSKLRDMMWAAGLQYSSRATLARAPPMV